MRAYGETLKKYVKSVRTYRAFGKRKIKVGVCVKNRKSGRRWRYS